ncbi:adenosylcobinamide-phosphate synthase CbiB [Magnetococcales bacterium HHB-1]
MLLFFNHTPPLFDLLFLLTPLLALLLDRLFGETKYFHPLVGFGHLAIFIETKINNTPQKNTAYIKGLLSWLILVLPLPLLLFFLLQPNTATLLLSSFILYFTIGLKSLEEHAIAVEEALQQSIPQARKRVSYLVSRDSQKMNETEITKATMESVLENGCDAVFSPLFWYLLFGAPGALLYRLANTLDAMWGYRTPRFNLFGYATARLDDLLNFIPARLTALTYALSGHFKSAIKSWRNLPHWKSPNAGIVMTTGAGALQCQLGGDACYHGKIEKKPTLGLGRTATPEDIPRTIMLVNKGVLFWFFFHALLATFIFMM